MVTKADVRGTASCVMFMAFFGTIWANIGIGGLRVTAEIWLLMLAILIGAALFLSGIMMIRRSRDLPNSNRNRDTKNIDKWFNIICIAEFGLIGINAIVTNIIGHFE